MTPGVTTLPPTEPGSAASHRPNAGPAAAVLRSCSVIALSIASAAISAADASPVAEVAAGATFGEASSSTAPGLRIEVHPEWIEITGSAVAPDVFEKIAAVVETTFPRRCFSATWSPPAAAPDGEEPINLPDIDLHQLPEILHEMAANGQPMSLEWDTGTGRFTLGGDSYSEVVRAAIELRLRLAVASTSSGATNGKVGDLEIDNRILVVEPPRSRVSRPVALGAVIRREFAHLDRVDLPPLQLQPVYFTHRGSRVAEQELPKLVDVVDQLSARFSADDWPRVIVTGYILDGGKTAELSAALRRATSVRNELVALGMPEGCFVLEAIHDKASPGLTWRSRRVEITVDASVTRDAELATAE